MSVSGVGSTWANGGGIVYVGGSGSGAIDIAGGGQLTAQGVYIATETGSNGDVNVTGPNSTLTTISSVSGGGIAVGFRGTGSLDVTAGGTVESKEGLVGYGGESMFGSTGVGTALVDGADSNWTNSGYVYVGSFNATGALTISNGGRVTNTTGFIGLDGGNFVSDRNVGTVNVTGSTSLWNNSGDLYLGRGPVSDGTLNITSGGRVNSINGYVGSGYVGSGNDSTGNVTVDGLNSMWNNTANLHVGSIGSGTLTISNGGRVTSSIGYIGFDDTGFLGDHSIGTVNVTGSSSLWDNNNGIYLGYGLSSDGTLNITSGGRVDSNGGYVSSLSGSTGSVTVDGLNSRWNNTGDLLVGFNGSAGTLTVTNNGTVQAPTIWIYSLGEARGNGTLVGFVLNGGLVSPGTSPGALNINGDYAQFAAGELLVELAATGFDQLLVSGIATLAGTLQVELLDGFIPSVGQTFTILSAGDVNNVFDMKLFPPIPGIGFDVIYNAQSVVLEVVEVLIPGDFDLDRDVDGDDFLKWQRGQSFTPFSSADLADWEAYYGTVAPSPSSAATTTTTTTVPEPTALWLAFVGPAFGNLPYRLGTKRVLTTR